MGFLANNREFGVSHLSDNIFRIAFRVRQINDIITGFMI